MILGIDLGTTNSLGAVFQDGEVTVIPGRLGGKLTPSVVSIDEDGTVYVGETALERKSIDPANTISVFKRAMGTDRQYEIHGKKYRAEDLSAFVLRSIKEDAETYLGQTIEEAVISVPAYFNDRQRKATKRAGELAGFKVERIINEPTAAAIAYGIDKREDESRYLVFDLGGGTLDVSILELDDTIMEVRAVAGDNFLGGEDFTDVLYRMFINKFNIDETVMPLKTLTHIKRQAEKCKKEFCEKDKILFSAVIEEEPMHMEVTLAEYEQACQLLFERIKKPIERSLRDAKIRLEDISEVVLVGGATKLPIVRRFVGRLMGRPAKVEIDPDEAIATGVALQAAMKERNEDIKEIVLTDVCPYSLGTDTSIRGVGDSLESGYFDPIIERNTVIPASRTKRYWTVRNNQRSVSVDVLQGESRLASGNLLLGKLTVPVPPRPAGQESITVTFTYDINSLLEVIVKVDSTNVTKKMIIKGEDSVYNDEQAAERMAQLDYLKIHPRDQEENKLLLLKAERMYEEALGDLRPLINRAVMEFESVLERQNGSEIQHAREDFKDALSHLEVLMEDQLTHDYLDDPEE
ncbi:MAG: molecular chaperone HscC [Firmicutes bacterium]|nr:molecular chaperone HscC [Bacillota bacterium]